MAQTEVLKVTERTKFGKGASRQDRRSGLVPAVLYGHHEDPKHLNLPAKELSAILRHSGTNSIIDLHFGKETQLALTKQIVVHPIKNYIQHVDLLIVRRGEKITVEVSINLEGSAAAGTTVIQDANTLEVEAEAMHIPTEIVVSIEGLEVGSQILASDLKLPQGVTLVADPETLIVNITEVEEADMGDEEDAEATETAEGEEAKEEKAESEAESDDKE